MTVHLTADEALVLFEWLVSSDKAERLRFEHAAEQAVLWGIEAQLEKALVVTFWPDYAEQLAAARERIAGAKA